MLYLMWAKIDKGGYQYSQCSFPGISYNNFFVSVVGTQIWTGWKQVNKQITWKILSPWVYKDKASETDFISMLNLHTEKIRNAFDKYLYGNKQPLMF